MAVIGAAVALSSSPASAVDGAGNIINQNSGKCLEVADWSQANGATVRQWTCSGGANQKWFPAFNATGKVYMNKNSGKLLEIADWSQSNGALARQWSGGFADGGVQANQAWGRVLP
ncbi:RICIN domain-containing protein [Streptomyces sp. NPDC054883]